MLTLCLQHPGGGESIEAEAGESRGHVITRHSHSAPFASVQDVVYI